MISADAYHWIYLIFITLIVLVYINGNSFRFSLGTNDYVSPSQSNVNLIFWTLVLFIGTRPLSDAFSDMLVYAITYDKSIYDVSEIRNEPAWMFLRFFCKEILSAPVGFYFFVITFLSLLLKLLFLRRIFENYLLIAFLFVISSFSFWSNETVIIRSDLANSLVLFGGALFMTGQKKERLYALVLFAIALNTHTASFLLIISFIVSYFFLKNTKLALGVWVFCLAASLVAGGFFEDFFINMGFDDRLEKTLRVSQKTGFSYTGFRWDFLLYSIVPIIVGWKFRVESAQDKIYSVLLNTYILANAFWLLVIRALFSDRFAGLSWTLYGVVLCYPILKLQLPAKRAEQTKQALLYQLTFLWFIQIYYEFFK